LVFNFSALYIFWLFIFYLMIHWQRVSYILLVLLWFLLVSIAMHSSLICCNLIFQFLILFSVQFTILLIKELHMLKSSRVFLVLFYLFQSFCSYIKIVNPLGIYFYTRWVEISFSLLHVEILCQSYTNKTKYKYKKNWAIITTLMPK
jgi:hypothetical protein